MSNASEVKVSAALETTWGTKQPAATWAYQRITGESLENNVGTTESAELTPSRRPGDLIRNATSAQGDLNIEWSNSTFQMLLEAAMHKAPVTVDVDTVAMNVAAAGSVANFDSGGADEFATIVAGQWIKCTGFINPANDGYSKVVSKIDNDEVVVISDRTYVNENTATAVFLNANSFTVGTTAKSLSIEKEFPQLVGATLYQLFTGMRVNTWSISVAPGRVNTGSFGFLGKIGSAVSTTKQAVATVAPATTTRVTNAITDVFSIREGSFQTDTSLDITEITINMNNQLRTREAVGVLGAVQIGLGTVQIQGTINAYLEDAAMINKFINDTTSSITFRLEDTSNNSTIITLPSIKFTSGRIVAGGQNTDVIAELGYTAQADAISGQGIVVDIFDTPL